MRTVRVVGVTYRQAMTLLILFAGIVTALVTVVGYVARRDRRGRGSFVDPSVSRAALTQAERQGVLGYVAAQHMPISDSLGRPMGSHSQANRT
jgi:crotonobetainyl-CoA:carnitine CoA-transferase CaiB-like acyl-CoA transferase